MDSSPDNLTLKEHMCSIGSLNSSFNSLEDPQRNVTFMEETSFHLMNQKKPLDGNNP